MTRGRVERLRDVGLVFRPISAICWEMSHLRPDSLQWSMPQLLSYGERLKNALERVDSW